MKGDFTRGRFESSKHYNRVLKQQGRVELDADWNEQAAISQHLLRTLIVDLLGRGGGPVDNCGFGFVNADAERLTPKIGDFILSAGRYYVDGLLVENERALYYSAQPEWPEPELLTAGKTYLVYLDVWERHITYLEDDGIREVALGGPDTTTRVKTLWQVKVLEASTVELPRASREVRETPSPRKRGKQAAAAESRSEAVNPPTASEALLPDCDALLQPLRDWTSGTMAARVEPAELGDPPCVLPPESRYRGLENHLYRVEVHTSGDTANPDKVPTFKWSRDNGAVATRWLGTTGNDVRVASTRDFAAGQWVEFTTETDELLGRPGPLSRITRVEGDVLTVEKAPALHKDARLPKVRRWDQSANDELTLTEGAIVITPGAGEEGWIELEDGIEVQFTAGQYRSGDYWLIPARVATGSIQWPSDDKGKGLSLPPEGITHHYAPLLLVAATAENPYVALRRDCRCMFAPLPCLQPDVRR